MNILHAPQRRRKLLIRKSYAFFGLFFALLIVGIGVLSVKPVLKETQAVEVKPGVAKAPKQEVLPYSTCTINPYDFSDVGPGHPAADGVYAFAKCCVVQGFSVSSCQSLGRGNACYGPEFPITRLDVGRLIARYHVYITKDWVLQNGRSLNYFRDVNPDNYSVDDYNLIMTAKYYGFMMGSSPSCTSMATFPSYTNSSCYLNANDPWTYGFRGITRNDNFRGRCYSFYSSSCGPIPDPLGTPRSQFIQDMYTYFKDNPQTGSALGQCLDDVFTATCTISATNCTTNTPGATCNTTVNWNSDGEDVAIFKDGGSVPIWTGKTGVNRQDVISTALAPGASHTYVCKNNGEELAHADAIGTLIQTPRRISGKVFLDEGGDTFSTGDAPYPQNKNVTITFQPNIPGVTVNVDQVNKTYTIQNIPPNISTITVYLTTTYDEGYYPSVPINTGSTPAFSVPVGSCPANLRTLVGSPEVECSGGNITELNFGITNSFPWTQFTGLDVRADKGITNNTPQTLTSSCSDPREPGKGMLLATGYTPITNALPQTSGVLFANPTPGSGPPFGDISQHNWKIGGENYGVNNLALSYDKIKENYGQTNDKIKTFTCSAVPEAICSLPTTEGVWHFDGDPALEYKFSGGTITGNVFVLVDGKVRFVDPITVNNGGVFVIASTGDMTVDKGVGYSATSGYSCSKAGNLQGIFSTYTDFIVEGNPSVCSLAQKDNMLIIDGTVITNADLKPSATEIGFKNKRHLCESNLQFPAVVIRQKPEFITKMPSFIKNQKVTFREVNP